jgi:CheY-like chemotaxis protein
MPQPFSVLVVDDYPDSADASAQMIALYGYEARAAHSCREARDLVAAGFAPDLLLLDVVLNDGDGYALAAELSALLARKPVLVAMTGLPGQEERSRGAGFAHLLFKPADPGELRALLDRYARGAVGGSTGQPQ